MKLPICEYFYSIQGEGTRIGRPSLFIRVTGCNLRCVFRKNDEVVSKCDTPYSSFSTTTTENIDIDSIIALYETDHANVKDIVITGGEPLLYQSQIIELLDRLYSINSDINVTIETNGSIEPCDELIRMVDLFSVSPKLANSEPREEDGVKSELCKVHHSKRININALTKLCNKARDIQLKFVYTDRDIINEINDIVYQIQEDCSIDVNNKVMLMPEGVTEEAIRENSLEAVDICLDHGWIFSTRLHILIWGNKRGV